MLESLNLPNPPLLTFQTSAQLGIAVLACNLSTQVAEAEVQSQWFQASLGYRGGLKNETNKNAGQSG